MASRNVLSMFIPRRKKSLILCFIISIVFITVSRILFQEEASIFKRFRYALADLPKPTKPAPKYYLCTDFVGGLGNHLFQYAGIYGISRLKNYKLFIADSNKLRNKFSLSAEVRNTSKECHNFTTVIEKHFCAFSTNIVELPNNRSYRLGHYLQSWKYFYDVEDEIKKEFTFSKDIQNKARDGFNKIIKNNGILPVSMVTFVGVHVRRGDIKSVKQFTSYGYLVPEKEYFLKAFQIMRKTFKNVVFVVSSNDPSWVKENLLTEHNVTMIVDNNPPEVDMAILTLCNHTIMSVGSFGWWSGYLTDGLTIYYRYPAKEGSDLRKKFSNQMFDYYYPGWMGLE